MHNRIDTIFSIAERNFIKLTSVSIDPRISEDLNRDPQDIHYDLIVAIIITTLNVILLLYV